MKLADRMKIAAACEAIATRHGAEVEIRPKGFSGKEQETIVHATWPDIALSFTIWEVHDGGVLVSFYGAAKDLKAWRGFDSINLYHKRKASTYFSDVKSEEFMCWFETACAAIKEGRVFEEAA